MEAYSAANQKLHNSQSEQTSLQKTILDLKVDLRCERSFVVSQKEVVDLQKQVTVLLKAHEQASARVKSLEEDLAKLRSELVTLRMERDKMGLEAKFAQEKLHGSMKEFQHQRADMDDLISRNVELQRLLLDNQQKVRESSDSIRVAEELSRKLSMEVSFLKQEKEILITSEKRASDEVGSLSKRVHRFQATLETIQSTEEIREEARGTERRKQEEYIKRIEKEWAEAKKDLQQERDSARTLRLERQGSLSSAIKQVEEMRKELSNALHAVATAESKAAVTELKVKGKDSQLQEIQRSILEKEERIFHLEQEVGRCRTEIDDGETRVNELLKVERELDIENQALSKQLGSLKYCMLTASSTSFVRHSFSKRE